MADNNQIINDYLSSIDGNSLKSMASQAKKQNITGSIRGRIVKIDTKNVIVDIGLKEEGSIPIGEFKENGKPTNIQIGDEVTIYRSSSADGHSASFSRSRARIDAAWSKLEQAHNNKQAVDGLIIDIIKGGYIVEILSAPAFLPDRQLEATVSEPKSILGNKIKVKIIKLDRKSGSVTLSQKQATEYEETNQEFINAKVEKIEKDQAILKHNDQTYTLPARDYLWEETEDLTTTLKEGQSLRVKIMQTTGNITYVSHKHLVTDPWYEAVKQSGLVIGASLEGVVAESDTDSVITLKTTPPIGAILKDQKLEKNTQHIFTIKDIDKKHSKVFVTVS